MATLTPDQRAGRPLGQVIAGAVEEVNREFGGQGLGTARGFVRGNAVIVVMRNTLNRGERSLIADGNGQAALRLRGRQHEAMRAELVAQVEALTGRTVISFVSRSDLGPDVTVQLYVLDRPAGGG